MVKPGQEGFILRKIEVEPAHEELADYLKYDENSNRVIYTPKSAHDLELIDLVGASLIHIKIYDAKDNIFTYYMKIWLKIIDPKATPDAPTDTGTSNEEGDPVNELEQKPEGFDKENSAEE